jgi:hypothetical protein
MKETIFNRTENLQGVLVGDIIDEQNLVLEVMPLFVMSDIQDMGAVVEVSDLGQPTLFLDDNFIGGVGCAEKVYELLTEICRLAWRLTGNALVGAVALPVSVRSIQDWFINPACARNLEIAFPAKRRRW